LPVGDRLFAYPKLMVDSRKKIHLLWGETKSPPVTFAAWPLTVTELWHATYDGQTWGAPERIAARDGLRWGAEGQLALDSSGVIHVMVPLVLNNGTQPVMHLRWNRGRWDTRDIPAFATAATLVSFARDSLLAVLLGVDTRRKSSHDAMLLTRSVDGGSSWSIPATIESLSNAPGRSPLIRRAAGHVYLAWLQRRSDVLGDEAIRYVVSRDAGTTWSPLLEGHLPGVTLSHSFVVDRCNRPVGIVSQFDGAKTRLFGLRPSVDSLTLQPAYAFLAQATGPGLGGSARLSLVWTGLRSSNGAATLLYSSLAACACSRRDSE
jgi:hypothetical protein